MKKSEVLLKNNRNIILLVIAGVAALCFACLACGITVYSVSKWIEDKPYTSQEPIDVQVVPATDYPRDEDLGPGSSSTLETLQNVIIPINDPIDIAQRLEGKENIPLTLPVEEFNLPVGTQRSFWVTNTDTAENFQIEATLAAATDHLYFWVENGVDYSQKALDKLAADFENNIYPTNREFFGSEWYPGVDNDPHLYVIYARGLGFNLAGYYSSIDEYHPLVHEFSNAHETFMLSADNAGLNDGYTYGVLAHEFQHMIHWYRDRNETSWLNEGFSELATLLTGHRSGPTHDYYFADDPDTQLNDWPNDPNGTIPHYGNSFLFVTYFMDRFGSEATKALVADEANGLTSVDQVLQELAVTDPETNRIVTADEVFLDWVVTNILKDEYNVSDRFKYISYPDAPRFYPTESIDDCSTASLARDVHQYAADYIELGCGLSYQIRFSGQEAVRVLPEDPYSGDFAFWSNKGDHSNMRLTREFDFRDLTGPITLDYHLWYDLEEDYDYVFLEVSTDGENWQIIRTPSSTSDNPSGNSYGWGYNGLSGGDGSWIQETVDMSNYAGEKVLVRFEYITDAAVHGEGLMLDSLSVPELDYYSDFEDDNGGWIAEGFVRIENSLPQTYRLALIHLTANPRVEYISVSDGDQIDIPVDPQENGSHDLILVVAGTTRFTRQKANYWLELIQD